MACARRSRATTCGDRARAASRLAPTDRGGPHHDATPVAQERLTAFDRRESGHPTPETPFLPTPVAPTRQRLVLSPTGPTGRAARAVQVCELVGWSGSDRARRSTRPAGERVRLVLALVGNDGQVVGRVVRGGVDDEDSQNFFAFPAEQGVGQGVPIAMVTPWLARPTCVRLGPATCGRSVETTRPVIAR